MNGVRLISHTLDDQEAFAAAARASVRRQVAEILEERGLATSSELEICPRCGERTILAAQRATWVRERVTGRIICSPCGTELSVLELLQPEAELGGEG